MEIKPGLYRHFKGKMYRMVGVARHSETLAELVVYWDENDKLWVRPKEMFEEIITRDGKKMHRFEFIK